jgi:hypothetical protein
MVLSTYDSHMSQVFKDISYESQLSVAPGISTSRYTLIGHVGPQPPTTEGHCSTLGV